MKKLDLFSIRGMSRTVIDNLMIENNYKILDVDFNENTSTLTDVTYKKQGVLDLRIRVSFCDNILYKVTFC